MPEDEYGMLSIFLKIFINQNKLLKIPPEERQAFGIITLLHEIAHLLTRKLGFTSLKINY